MFARSFTFPYFFSLGLSRNSHCTFLSPHSFASLFSTPGFVRLNRPRLTLNECLL